MRYVEDMSQAQIAAEVGLSQMQISRILLSTLTRLRADMLAERPDEHARSLSGRSTARLPDQRRPAAADHGPESALRYGVA
jgi:hypothetical protein